MTNNAFPENVNQLDGEIIERAQKRLEKAYAVVLRKGLKGGWRKVAFDLGLKVSDVRYVWELARLGKVPTNPVLRKAFGLPKVMPSERVVKVRKSNWRDEVGRIGLERLNDMKGRK